MANDYIVHNDAKIIVKLAGESEIRENYTANPEKY